MKTQRSQQICIYLLLLSLTLLGCGGGSGGGNNTTQSPTPPPAGAGATLSGTAATGQPIQGSVFILDALGMEINTAIDAFGAFNAVVDGLTPPFLLRAIPNNGSSTQFSYAASANQTVNITPLTSLVLFLTNNNQALSQLYANWPTSQGVVTAAGLSQAQTLVNQTFQLQYTAAGISNPLLFNVFSTVFLANAQGIDAVLDLLNLLFDSAAGTVTYQNGSGNRQLFNLTNPVNTAHILGPKNVFDLPFVGGRVDLSEYHADLVYKLIHFLRERTFGVGSGPGFGISSGIVFPTSFAEVVNGQDVNQLIQSGDNIPCFDANGPAGRQTVSFSNTDPALQPPNIYSVNYVLSGCDYVGLSGINRYSGDYSISGSIDGSGSQVTLTSNNLSVSREDGAHKLIFDGEYKRRIQSIPGLETISIDPSGFRVRDEDNTFDSEGLYVENVLIEKADIVFEQDIAKTLFMLISSDNNNQSSYRMQVELLVPPPVGSWGFTIRPAALQPPLQGGEVLTSIVTVEIAQRDATSRGVVRATVSVDTNGDGVVADDLIERMTDTSLDPDW
ncbi:MAG: hypothetical protein V3V50_03090 [Gammaproteobacteria bacterium]